MANGPLVISVESACTRQLEAAIRMFFLGADEVAIHTLVCAAREIARNVAGDRERGLDLDVIVRENIPTPTQRQAREGLIEAQNFFKHCGRDATETVTLRPQLTEILLIDACAAYEAAFGKRPLIGIFKTWMHLEFERPKIDPSDPDLVEVAAFTRQQFFLSMLETANNVHGREAAEQDDRMHHAPANPRPPRRGKRR